MNWVVDEVNKPDRRKRCHVSSCECDFDVVEVGHLLLRLDEERGDWFFAARLIEGLLGLIFAQLPRAEG